MKKVLIIFLSLFLMFSTPAFASNQSNYEKALLSLMWEEIYRAVDEYYLNNEGLTGVQTWNKKVLDLKMTDGLSFEITIQLDAFVGAHNTIGTDTLKFTREIDGLKLVNYNHTPSKHKEEILEWYLREQS
ncbi:DUF3888 domain-containing protein [Gracilibacillus sp. YIM 98692]|uniref:DUF3888 domain-containing protein n=1 Tax=Gracilibacillus sp. YIM 98692 TaxID=2663532 RepID=UPI0013CF668A|nr:DUF3888 domain-containing protein [Gracilibacillus sp. YIM 98692]